MSMAPDPAPGPVVDSWPPRPTEAPHCSFGQRIFWSDTVAGGGLYVWMKCEAGLRFAPGLSYIVSCGQARFRDSRGVAGGLRRSSLVCVSVLSAAFPVSGPKAPWGGLKGTQRQSLTNVWGLATVWCAALFSVFVRAHDTSVTSPHGVRAEGGGDQNI